MIDSDLTRLLRLSEQIKSHQDPETATAPEWDRQVNELWSKILAALAPLGPGRIALQRKVLDLVKTLWSLLRHINKWKSLGTVDGFDPLLWEMVLNDLRRESDAAQQALLSKIHGESEPKGPTDSKLDADGSGQADNKADSKKKSSQKHPQTPEVAVLLNRLTDKKFQGRTKISLAREIANGSGCKPESLLRQARRHKPKSS